MQQMGYAPTPWRLKEMTATIVIRSADGATVCNLPLQKDRERRMANAKMIVRAVNSLAAAEREMVGFSPETIATLQKQTA